MPLATTLVTECEFPSLIEMDRRWIDAAYFQDSYRSALSRKNASIVNIFHAIFTHHPKWIKIALIIRNKVASFCGLDAPTASEIMHPEFKSSYAVGDKIGVWPILILTGSELIAGRDNQHLDFRLSVLRLTDDDTISVVVSTVCVVHNNFGKIYLFFITPFHKWGVRQLMSRAVVAGRL